MKMLKSPQCHKQFLSGMVLLIIFVISATEAQCPVGTAIQPCTCVDDERRVELTCRGSMGLPRLTTILRKGMCGKNIHRFNLIGSDVEYLPSNLFFKVKVRNIQVSSMSISHFTRAGRSAFFGQEFHLRFLSMRRCRLVDSLQWQMIGELQVLAYLDLAFNDLTIVRNKWFQNPPPRLLSLILKGNKITTLETGALSKMHSLIQLDLSQNRITMISRDFLPQNTNQLIFLTLSDNQLNLLPEDMFDEMSNLRRINLDYNRMETLPEKVWSPVWGDLQKLDLGGNPLSCDNVEWIKNSRSPSLLYGFPCRHLKPNSTMMVSVQTYN